MASRQLPELRRVRKALREYGLLLESDACLPSVTLIITGGPVRGPWWSHPQSHIIYDVSQRLADQPDVSVTKLVSRKVTYVHCELWPALVAVGMAREPWQWQGLSHTASSLLAIVDREHVVRTDHIPWARGAPEPSPGDAARELENALLVYSEQLHTHTGAHAKQLESWAHWARRVGFKVTRMRPDKAKQQLMEKLEILNTQFGAKGKLPWSPNAPGKRAAAHPKA